MASWSWKCERCGLETCDSCSRRPDLMRCPAGDFHQMAQRKAGLSVVEAVLALAASEDAAVQIAAAHALAEMSIFGVLPAPRVPGLCALTCAAQRRCSMK